MPTNMFLAWLILVAMAGYGTGKALEGKTDIVKAAGVLGLLALTVYFSVMLSLAY